MGRIGKETTPSHQGLEFQEIHQNTVDDPPPPPQEEDLYEPPAEYQPPPRPPTKQPPPPQVVHNFPPLQDEDHGMPPPQKFPPPPTSKPAQEVHSFPPPQNEDYAMSPPKQFPPLQEEQQTLHPFPAQKHGQYTGRPHHHQPTPPQPQQHQIPIVMANSPFMPQQNQPWKTDLFDCMKNPQNALITLCFPCVTFGQIAEILDNGSTTCATSGILYTCIAICIAMPCLMSCGYRSKLRAKFGLVESPAPDCLIHCFCEYCALCQEYRELQERGFDPSIGHAGNMAKQQSQQRFGFTPPMQQRMMM